MKPYRPLELEPRIRKLWADTDLYRTQDPKPDQPKKYILDMFAYPSGAGVHLGHVLNYGITDTLSRYYRMQGYAVLQATGWDAFGLPTENYAIKNKIAPELVTKKNTDIFRDQYQALGIGYDWHREINTSDPEYYRWTQWLFLLLHKRGLAYKKAATVNWDPIDKTVLANEQIVNGHADRSGALVEKKVLNQWFFKITDYADRLLEDLDELDWPEKIKAMQRNWIGRSVGTQLDFKVDGQDETVTVFTTRVDTLYGATYLVLAPEHELVAKLTIPDQRAKVNEYVKTAGSKSEIERMETDRKKTGVFTGSYGINPATGEPIPIWVADYVLMGYGTGAIMAVPAHDERDFEFAQVFDLPIVEVIEPITGVPQTDPQHRRSIVALVEDPDSGKLISINWGAQLGGNLFIGGGIDEGEDMVKAAQREIAEETGYTDLELVGQTGKVHHHYYAHSKKQARLIEAVGLHFRLKSHAQTETKLEADEAGKFTVEWLTRDQIGAVVSDQLHRHVYDRLILGQCYAGEGLLVNSGEYDGQNSAVARDKMVKAFGKEQVNYKMRDWLISRQRYWGAPIPIIHCPEHGAVPVPEDQLPVKLPALESYEPTDDGRSPLAKVTDWVNTTCPVCGGPAERETDTMDGFACSSWYFMRFADPHNHKAAFSREAADKWLPVDMYVGGAEHAVMHLLYARMWTKVMYDEGLISFTEPFTALRNQGMIQAADGEKMSKSKGNVVNPSDLINDGYGADALHMYVLFMGPYDQAVRWNANGIDGTKRFLNRLWALVQEQVDGKGNAGNDEIETAIATVVNKTIKKVTGDLEQMSFNTAIAAMMEAVNELYKLKTRLPASDSAWRTPLQQLVQLLAPFAPFVSEQMWSDLGGEGSVHRSQWPAWDDNLVREELTTVIVQVNGKLRARLELAVDSDEAEVIAQAKEKVADWLQGEPVKTIAVPNKLVNFVVR